MVIGALRRDPVMVIGDGALPIRPRACESGHDEVTAARGRAMADEAVTAAPDGAVRPGQPAAAQAPAERDAPRPTPTWVAPVFAGLAALTVPWVVFLAASLPRTVRVHDRTAWVGFDILLVLMLGVTAYLAWRGRPRVALAAVATATMLAIDAWFDVLTSRDGMDRAVAVGMAVMELTLAAVCVWIALHAGAVVRRRIAALARRHQDRVG
jgi:hypothetical protein